MYPRVRKASWMSSRISRRIRGRRNQCRWQGALDTPTVGAESGAVFGAASRDERLYAERADETAVFVVVVATVTKHDVGPGGLGGGSSSPVAFPAREGWVHRRGSREASRAASAR